MKIQYASDLHLEFALNMAYIKKYPLITKGDILILAGDTTLLSKKFLQRDYFDTFSSQFEQIYLIPGNHEFYNKLYPIENIFPSLEKKVRDNVTYLNNRVVYHDDTRIIFTTLFSRISDSNRSLIQRSLADFHNSRYYHDSNLSLSIDEYNDCHDKCLSFLEQVLQEDFKGKTVVVTHHVPYTKSYIPNYPDFEYDLSEAFYVNLKYLVEQYKIDHWISGHTHINHPPIKIRNTWFHTNQLGYIENDEHKAFNREAVIEV